MGRGQWSSFTLYVPTYLQITLIQPSLLLKRLSTFAHEDVFIVCQNSKSGMSQKWKVIRGSHKFTWGEEDKDRRSP
ncbi:hypothetical protein H5410_061411 [Solanum commersonii]|uniref:Uncharacterized protein n=1 Tax=Solanum commersonii TaxID=4109 RepID=A0A9J5W7Q6_SOLCO|nr:hypothetical protein H5410_061411 [Solanum commersonii]